LALLHHLQEYQALQSRPATQLSSADRKRIADLEAQIAAAQAQLEQALRATREAQAAAATAQQEQQKALAAAAAAAKAPSLVSPPPAAAPTTALTTPAASGSSSSGTAQEEAAKVSPMALGLGAAGLALGGGLAAVLAQQKQASEEELGGALQEEKAAVARLKKQVGGWGEGTRCGRYVGERWSAVVDAAGECEVGMRGDKVRGGGPGIKKEPADEVAAALAAELGLHI
jgi:hypothetical protein